MPPHRSGKLTRREQESSSESESEQDEEEDEQEEIRFRKRLHGLVSHCKNINSRFLSGRNIPDKNKVTKGIKRIALLSSQKKLTPLFSLAAVEFMNTYGGEIREMALLDIEDKDSLRLTIGKGSGSTKYTYLAIGQLFQQAKALDSDSKDSEYSYVEYMYLYLFRFLASSIDVTEEKVSSKLVEFIRSTIKRLEDSLEDDEDEDDEEDQLGDKSLGGLVAVAGKVMEKLGIDTKGKVPSSKEFESTVKKIFGARDAKKKDDEDSE